jgi:pantoate--beta-alanine ligase
VSGSTGRTAPGRIDLSHPELDRLEDPSRVPPVPARRPRRQATPPSTPEPGTEADTAAADPGPGGRPPEGPGPAVARTRAELATALAALRAGGRRLALVPTMGALHAGHLALVRAAAGRADAVVASIFVNPLQFGPAEDLDRYPRTPDADLAALAAEGVDLVFAPPAGEVYPGGPPAVSVDPGPLGGLLEGASRPGHFAGVLTVVTKLFGLVRPDVAVFGEKDYQQLTLIRRAVADLELGVEVIGVPTVREPDGLALSSRNRYLSDVERARALSLSRALRAGAAAAPAGAGAVLAAATAGLADPGLSVDYLALRGTDLGAAPDTGPARLLVAARVGSSRLIDNTPLVLGTG